MIPTGSVPLIKGFHQRGCLALQTDGWVPSERIADRGDQLSLYGVPELLFIADWVESDSHGNATIRLEYAVGEDVPDNTAITGLGNIAE